MLKEISICCAVLLLVAVFKLPMGYYTFLRVAITTASVIFIVAESKRGVTFWIVLFGIVAILFNPVIPIYLYKKAIWMPIDISVAILFLCYNFKNNSFSFIGRIGRTEYFLSIIIYVVAYFFIMAIMMENSDYSILGLAFIPLVWFMLSQGAKRCHDVNNSGWMQIIPFYGLWMIFQEGDRYSNSYGKSPKENEGFNNAPTTTSSYQVPVSKPAPIIIPVMTIPENQTTILEVTNVNYSLIQDIMKNLRRLDLIKNQSYSFLGNTATITINHRNTSQTLLDSLYSIMENIEVNGIGDGFINIKIK